MFISSWSANIIHDAIGRWFETHGQSYWMTYEKRSFINRNYILTGVSECCMEHMSDKKPLGKILDYFARIEFQGEVHMFLWFDNLPRN